jgi:CubicO group peptidase (beta-lactamase class C family)
MSGQRTPHCRARRTLPLLLSLSALCLTSVGGAPLAFAQAPATKPAPAARAHAAAQAPSSLPTAKPEDVGVSSERLERLDRTVQQYVDEGKVAGVVTLVARKGQVVQFGAYGKRDVESGSPMAKDAIFRIASMSKAITSVAIMMLMEEGKLTIADRLSKFIPQYKNTTVAVEYRDGTSARPVVVTVPAKREITIRDLLTHTSGVSYGAGLVEDQYKAANIHGWYFADKNEPIGPVIERLAALPFNSQPGEKYVYGFNTDILGVVVERASGMSLDEFFRTRIFTPLKMTDTHFFLPPEKRDRLVTVYGYNDAGKLERMPNPRNGQGDYVDGPRVCFSGGAGLLSTASDYARFLQMLLNGGELDGVRLLSPKTIELMTSNHIGSLMQEGKFGFGLGFEITEHVGRAGRPGSVGEFGWGGAYHTQMWVDPQEQLVVVYMTQTLPSGSLDLQPRFRALLYSSLLGAPGKKLPAATPKPAQSTAVTPAR